jgi:hypothetical protein
MVAPLASASAAPPSNDTLAGATVIGSLPFSATQNTAEATLDADDASLDKSCGFVGNTFSNSVWYTPSEDQVILVDTSGSNPSVGAAVVTSDFQPVPRTCFVSDFTGGGYAHLTAGTTYYIVLLQSPAGSGGTLQLSVQSEAIAPTAELTVDARGRVSKAGIATLTGTATCTGPAGAVVGAYLAQTVGRVTTTGLTEYEVVTCDGIAHPWSITVGPCSAEFNDPNCAVFRAGEAIVSSALEVCSPFSCVSDQVTRQTIRLKRRR